MRADGCRGVCARTETRGRGLGARGQPAVAAAVEAALKTPQSCPDAILALEVPPPSPPLALIPQLKLRASTLGGGQERVADSLRGLVKLLPPEAVDEYHKDAMRVVCRRSRPPAAADAAPPSIPLLGCAAARSSLPSASPCPSCRCRPAPRHHPRVPGALRGA